MRTCTTVSALSLTSAALAFSAALLSCGGEDRAATGTTRQLGDPLSGGAAVSLSSASVLMHHKNPNRDGHYIDAVLTKPKAMGLTRDTAFDGAFTGGVLGQPLYAADIAAGKDAVFIATETNEVYSLDGATGHINWTTSLGPPIPQSKLLCGHGIDPYGVTATGVIDPATRTVYYESFTTPDNGATFEHRVFALSIDNGSIRSGWPVKIDGQSVPNFQPSLQHDRGALALVNGVLYVPFAGLNGDCGNYHGWLVGIDTAAPATIKSWSTTASKGGAWGTSGVPSDGTHVYLTTGNTTGTHGTWGGGEAVLRFSSGPVFSKSTHDYFAPSNWLTLDDGDTDLGSSEAIVINVPGATPSSLLFAAGKEGKAFLINRGSDMGGVSDGVASLGVAQNEIKTAFAAYSTATGFYVVLHADTNGTHCPGAAGNLIAVRVSATSPPTLTTAWCANAFGTGSPMVTTTDGKSNAIVWIAGTVGSKLHGYDGDTGAPVFTGGGVNETMQSLRHWITPIEAKGRILVAGDGKVFAFK